MSFAAWQPKYADVGLPAFPVGMADGAKRPLVKGYLRVGIASSRQLAMRFGDADGIGIALGTRTKLTVLDIDSPDERVLADALDRHGKTPIVVRSGSGHHQAWFRHAGEGRRIRPFPKLPIDILGGGFVVGPWSNGRQNHYGFIAGRLDDVDSLPILRGFPSDIVVPASARTVQGARNDQLFRACMRRAHRCSSFDQLLAFAHSNNEEINMPALSADEVLKTAKSAWSYQQRGENRCGVSANALLSHELIDRLAAADPHAFALMAVLERHNQRRETFTIANAMAESMGWHIDRLRSARQALIDLGVIRCVHAGGRGPKDPALYAWI